MRSPETASASVMNPFRGFKHRLPMGLIMLHCCLPDCWLRRVLSLACVSCRKTVYHAAHHGLDGAWNLMILTRILRRASAKDMDGKDPGHTDRQIDSHQQYLKRLNKTSKVVCGAARLLMKLAKVRLLHGNQALSEVSFSQAAEPCCLALLQAESLQNKTLLSQTCRLKCYWGRLLSHKAMMMSVSRFAMIADAERQS